MKTIKKLVKIQEYKIRDQNIKLSIQGDIDMSTKIIKDKTKYSRKEKYQNINLEEY